MNIIVVDDKIQDLQYFLKEVLGQEKIQYHFFLDDFVKISHFILTHSVDCALLDIKMPNMDGITLANQLLQIDSTIKFIFITGTTFNFNELPEILKKSTIGFLYKPYKKEDLVQFLACIKKAKPILIAKMFDSFDCFIHDQIIKFSSSKSKELFALLLAYNGKTLTMADAISHLWPDYDLEKSKILYRDAVWRLRKTLKEVNLSCVQFSRAILTLDKTQIQCDYWDYLISGKGNYCGEFCKNYDWSIDYLSQLDAIKKSIN